MTPIEPVSANLTGDGGEPERLVGRAQRRPNLFATIGLTPIVGRTFVPDDGPAEPVVVSEAFWMRRFGGDPAAVGRTITLDGSAARGRRRRAARIFAFRTARWTFSSPRRSRPRFSPSAALVSRGTSSRSCARASRSKRRRPRCARSPRRSSAESRHAARGAVVVVPLRDTSRARRLGGDCVRR